MAGSLILFKNTNTPIEGTCEAAGYEKQLDIENASFGINAVIGSDDTGEVFQSAISFSVPFGPQVVQFQQALFHGHDLGDVTITEVGQALDAGGTKTWKKVREITLKHAWVESCSIGWSGISTMCQISLQYTDVTYAWGDKVAHYNRSEKS